LSVTTFDTAATAVALEEERSIRYWHMDRRASAKLMVMSWTHEAFRQAVDRSSLKLPVRNTLHAMVDNSAGGLTTIDRASLCRITGLRDEGTITEHFRKARAAGLLKSVRRHNKSSIHTLLIPGTDASAGEKKPGSQLANWHSWTAEEIAWWDDLAPENWTPPPWHPWKGHEPQF
jgi:hypothetical protein